MPKSILNDEYFEELSFPHLFPTGKFGYKVRRKILLSPVTYFNQRLLNYSQKFASDTDYIFFARNILQSLSLKEQINIAMRKVSGVSLNAGVLNNSCFNETVKQWVSDDSIRMEFQIRDSPHVHSFIWVISAPKLTLHNVDEYINWLDNIVSACLPDPKVDSTLCELVKTYQIHRHSKT